MLPYFVFYCILCLSKVTLAFEVIKGHKRRVESETIFNDVIKNISRVNNVLQDLITNYEQLQKLYKKQDSLESDYTKDTDSDERDEKKKQNKPDKTTQRSYDGKTQIIMSSYEEQKSNETYEDVKDFPIEETTKPEKNKNNKTSNAVSKAVLRLNFKLGKETKRSESITKKEKQLFGSELTTKMNKNNVKKKRKFGKHEVKKNLKKLDLLTTNKNIVEVRGTTKPANHITKKNNIFYVENFSSKSKWKAENIPINKTIQGESFEDSIIENDKNNAPNLRSRNGKTAVVVLTKLKKNHNKIIHTKDEREMDTLKLSSELREEIANINKDMFKTKILRQAYGDACLKLVIRKCYKACKAVIKIVCSSFKCKSPLKSSFNEHSRTGCIQFFDGAEPNIKLQTINKTWFRGAAELFTEERSASFVDLTRSGYLNGACMPIEREQQQPIERQPPIPRNETKQTALANPNEELNILRDRFEKACRNISRSKCKSACNFAYTETCNTVNCVKSMKKRFRKSCKSQCNRVYNSPIPDSSSSDSDSSDSSSSSSASSSVTSESSETDTS